MSGAVLPLPQYIFMTWCLVKPRDNFYLLAVTGQTTSTHICSTTFIVMHGVL